MHKTQPFFAVRVSIYNQEDGTVSTRDYVRGETRMGQQRFAAFALGDMQMLVNPEGSVQNTWLVTEIDFNTVKENRQYSHTTHGEANL